MCGKRENGIVGLIQRANKNITLAMVVNVKPRCSLVPMSIVYFSNVTPKNLCIVKYYSILRGIC